MDVPLARGTAWTARGASPPPPTPPARTPTDQLEEAFGVLANGQRLGLLRLLQEPHTASEIRLEPSEARRGGMPPRPMSTQAVRKHLEKLAEHGFLQRVPTSRRGVPAEAYVVNHARLYALAEEMRRLASLRPMAEQAGVTQQLGARKESPRTAAPRLVVVHGLQEGQCFPLAGDRLTVGRRKGSDVRLDYDPFVSHDHAEVQRARDGGWRLHDLGSRNGTHVNWQPLPKHGEQPLRHGDVVGVGRTLLLLWAG